MLGSHSKMGIEAAPPPPGEQQQQVPMQAPTEVEVVGDHAAAVAAGPSCSLQLAKCEVSEEGAPAPAGELSASSSVATPLRTFLLFMGTGFMAAVAFLDPGERGCTARWPHPTRAISATSTCSTKRTSAGGTCPEQSFMKYL